MPRLSVIIPAYDEADRIRETLNTLEYYFDQQDYAAEILVVLDGCTDATEQIVQAEFPKVQRLAYTPNRGKGHAVRTGMLAAQGDYRLFYDADSSTPIEEVEKLWAVFDDGADVVIGSRSLPESNVAKRQAWYRQTMGRIYNRILRLFRLTSFPDTQCGFKGFTAQACEEVFPRQTVEGFGFDVELLFIAAHQGLRVEQVPVTWINSPQSKVNPISHSFGMIFDSLRIRRNGQLGRYD